MDVKCKTCDIKTWIRYLFLDVSSTNIYTLVLLLCQCIKTHSIEVFDCCLSHSCTSVSTSLLSARLCNQGGFLADQTDGSHWGPSPGCKADVQGVPNVVLKFSPGLLGLYELWHCHDKAVPLLPVGLDVFCELHLLQQNFTV
jgi:hypothetical protein